jgi:hypothetical protein
MLFLVSQVKKEWGKEDKGSESGGEEKDSINSLALPLSSSRPTVPIAG